MTDRDGGGILPPLRKQATGGAQERGSLQVKIQTRLQELGYPELNAIVCEFHEGVVTLRGRVPTFYLKQLAQTRIGKLHGVEEIHNQIDVTAPPARP